MSLVDFADGAPEQRTLRATRGQATSGVNYTSRTSTTGSIKLEPRSRLMDTERLMSDMETKETLERAIFMVSQ